MNRIDDHPPFNDPFLDDRYMRTLNYAREVIHRGTIEPGTFSIEAPSFDCTVYNGTPENGGGAKSGFVVISAPLNQAFTITRERKRKQMQVPPGTTIGPTTDWISIKGLNETLDFQFDTDRHLMMFCRASLSSPSEP